MTTNKLRKYMIIQSPYNGSKAVWEFIDDLDEAMSYWYVREAIEKYGVESMMPIVMNKLGGYHTHRPDEPDVVGIIESVDWPDLRVWEQYPRNREDFRTGWVSPTGDTYSCDVFEHIECATMLAKQLYGEHTKTVSDDFLLRTGWYKVSNNKYTGYRDRMSDAQAQLFEKKGFRNHLDLEDLEVTYSYAN